MSIDKREAASRMRRLSDAERDEYIARAGNVVDCRNLFSEKQRQAGLAHAYRGPKGGGAA